MARRRWPVSPQGRLLKTRELSQKSVPRNLAIRRHDLRVGKIADLEHGSAGVNILNARGSHAQPLIQLGRSRMRRRVFIAGLGSTAARPLVARAKQSGTPVCGRFTPVTGTQARNRRRQRFAGHSPIESEDGRPYVWASGIKKPGGLAISVAHASRLKTDHHRNRRRSG
jgi:hypothetical protein